MILLAGIAIGLALGVGLGGRPSRLLQLSFRSGWAVALALGVQIVLFSRLGHSIPGGLARALHLATYGLLAVFVWRTPATLGFGGLLATGIAAGLCWLATLATLGHPARDDLVGMARHALGPLRAKLAAARPA